MDEQDRLELEQLRQLMDMDVYVSDEDGLQCNFTGCRCPEHCLELPARRTTLRDVADAMMEHRVTWLMGSQ